jgi:hypothetical protein
LDFIGPAGVHVGRCDNDPRFIDTLAIVQVDELSDLTELGVVYATTPQGIHQSNDGGLNWYLNYPRYSSVDYLLEPNPYHPGMLLTGGNHPYIRYSADEWFSEMSIPDSVNCWDAVFLRQNDDKFILMSTLYGL